MSELDKLEQYLKEHKIPYERIDGDRYFVDRHQITVFDENGEIQWDVICQEFSYGYSEGLLEAMGKPVVKKSDHDTVVGYLTAEDVIKRLESGDV